MLNCVFCVKNGIRNSESTNGRSCGSSLRRVLNEMLHYVKAVVAQKTEIHEVLQLGAADEHTDLVDRDLALEWRECSRFFPVHAMPR